MKIKQFILILLVFCGCTEYYPKPKGFLRVDASENYALVDSFSFARFETAADARILPEKKENGEAWVTIRYPLYHAELYGTYHSFSGKEELAGLGDDFYRLLERNVRDEKVYYARFEDTLRAAYGYLYWSDAPIPSPVQFFVTDSVCRFFRGAVYFSDSLSHEMSVPYAQFFSDEMMRLIETFSWR